MNFLPPSSKSSTKIVPPKQTASDEITFESKEADIVRLLVATIVEFFENTKSHPYIREKRTGKFSQMATKIGLQAQSEPDSRLEAIRHIVQKLVLVRNEDGEYTSLSYDLQLTGTDKAVRADIFFFEGDHPQGQPEK